MSRETSTATTGRSYELNAYGSLMRWLLTAGALMTVVLFSGMVITVIVLAIWQGDINGLPLTACLAGWFTVVGATVAFRMATVHTPIQSGETGLRVQFPAVTVSIGWDNVIEVKRASLLRMHDMIIVEKSHWLHRLCGWTDGWGIRPAFIVSPYLKDRDELMSLIETRITMRTPDRQTDRRDRAPSAIIANLTNIRQLLVAVRNQLNMLAGFIILALCVAWIVWAVVTGITH